MSEKEIDEYLTRARVNQKEEVKKDILATLSQFKNLCYTVELYIQPFGESQNSFTLMGTIPVTYQNAVYNLPIQLYLLETYPFSAPIFYLRPTNTMVLNVGDRIDEDGRVNIPYLEEWKGYPDSDLVTLLSILSLEFSEKTPLFST